MRSWATDGTLSVNAAGVPRVDVVLQADLLEPVVLDLVFAYLCWELADPRSTLDGESAMRTGDALCIRVAWVPDLSLD